MAETVEMKAKRLEALNEKFRDFIMSPGSFIIRLFM